MLDEIQKEFLNGITDGQIPEWLLDKAEGYQVNSDGTVSVYWSGVLTDKRKCYKGVCESMEEK